MFTDAVGKKQLSYFCRPFFSSFLLPLYCSNRETDLQLQAVLLDISPKIPPNKYYTLANKLGLTYHSAESVLITKCNNYEQAAASLLINWTTQNGSGSAQRAKLKQIFESTELGGLSSTFETEQPLSTVKVQGINKNKFSLLYTGVAQK